jgi:PLP dependent protein
MNELPSIDRGPDGSLAERLSQRINPIRQTLPPQVRLIAITKQVPVAAMRAAYAIGVRDFGENRIQEAETKQAELQDLPDITWHLIGHLQANKAQKALDLFHWIHTVDDLKLAQRLDRLAAPRALAPKVCLQVKLAPDPHKYGWSVPELWQDLPQLDQCQHLDIQGLMTIAPLGLSEPEQARLFQSTHELAGAIAAKPWTHLRMTELSMGMSGDYPLALAAGATMIRLGRILFGDRSI